MISSNSSLRLFVHKERLKFSSAHMTVFPDGTKERLHGHNYQASLSIEIGPPESAPFIALGFLKSLLERVCGSLDERLLLPTRCAFLAVQVQDELETTFVLCGKRYAVPSDEIAWIEADNLSTEALALHILNCVRLELRRQEPRLVGLELEITVTETPGQGCSARGRS